MLDPQPGVCADVGHNRLGRFRLLAGVQEREPDMRTAVDVEHDGLGELLAMSNMPRFWGWMR